ncbi:hypothetical protein CDAR_315891 [Caerostris darwini]|uniref:Uncharacterized protein n=1 Tax=Caerostris darwini TaxID=1538125 RepID=A0AAV4M9A6_9ARAC|nr:hypothetical protein CDAR_315891 [Caerostris darwini]
METAAELLHGVNTAVCKGFSWNDSSGKKAMDGHHISTGAKATLGLSSNITRGQHCWMQGSSRGMSPPGKKQWMAGIFQREPKCFGAALGPKVTIISEGMQLVRR